MNEDACCRVVGVATQRTALFAASGHKRVGFRDWIIYVLLLTVVSIQSYEGILVPRHALTCKWL